MQIRLNAGVGRGPTRIAAFDSALMDAGASHYNLLYLSSVVPPGAEIVEGPIDFSEDEYGHRRYVVIARATAIELGEEAWAGLGWCQDESRKGIFVEIEGHSESQVIEDIEATLDAMKASRKALALGPNQRRVAGAKCEGEPVCVVVIAAFPNAGAWPAPA